MSELVDQILSRIHLTGVDSALPEAAIAEFRVALEARREERQIFVTLAYCSVELREKGLLLAAEQLLELARIGLQDDALAGALRDARHASPARASSGLGWRRTTHKPD
jgi:hypothetical protein